MYKDPKYRPNVGIVLADGLGHVLMACRRASGSKKNPHWQFPQGGIEAKEKPTETLFRELHEELGLTAQSVRIISQTRDWLRYSVPLSMRKKRHPSANKYSANFVGQTQKWFLLEMLAPASAIDLNACLPAEFHTWRWVRYWHPLHKVVFFKRAVYREVLRQFIPAHHQLVQGKMQAENCSC